MNCNILLQHTTPPPPHKIINFTQFCREQIIIKQLHYLYPPFSILHIMGSAIQKQWWLILNLYFDPPPPPRPVGPAAGGRIHTTPLPKIARHILEVLTECANDQVSEILKLVEGKREKEKGESKAWYKVAS